MLAFADAAAPSVRAAAAIFPRFLRAYVGMSLSILAHAATGLYLR